MLLTKEYQIALDELQRVMLQQQHALDVFGSGSAEFLEAAKRAAELQSRLKAAQRVRLVVAAWREPD
ncbi:hypothetical protein [Sabulicella glaciei]|uniref:Uncharacterized protein n=1 Tax=Sabulicella glaciei TaxID=2984948 RepID=A0ABT3P1P9_9PROT|nr:hypothetical protein [Roseococcus sp. MDT2-1-1]MCW8088332.1 hypothetical protein [Roseococcus sp. MDT2-1-1]